MDQRLKLQADLKNNVSPQLKKIGKDLQEVRRTPGMEQAQKWFSNFNETAESFGKSGATAAGVMGAIGVGGLTAAASLAEMVKQFKELGDHTFAVKKLGQETGLTIDQVRKWEYVGQIFRMPVEQMDGALKTLGDQMVDFKRRRGELFGQLSQQFPQFALKLENEDTEHQVQDILGFLGSIKDAAARNRWAKEFFGTDDIGALLTNGMPALNKAIQDAAQNVQPMTEALQQQADAYNASLVQFNQTWDNFKTEVGPAVFDQLKKAVDDFKGVFDEIRAAWGWLQNAKEHPAEAAKQVGDAADKAFNDKADEFGQRWHDRIQALKQDFGAGVATNEDGNALRRNDETVAAPQAAPAPTKASDKPAADGAEIESWWSRLKKRIDFEGGGDDRSSLRRNIDFGPDFDGAPQTQASPAGGTTFGLAGLISDGTKDGVLAAFREWAEEQQVGQQGGGTAGGIVKADYETWDGGGSGSGGQRGGGPEQPPGANLSGGDVAGEHADYIREIAKRLGIDPRTAVAVAKSEGLDNPVGDHGTSFGDFQLHIGGGLGDTFRRETGLDPADQAHWREQDEWALKYAAKHGWGDWHGAARIGVTGMMGIGGASEGGGGDPDAPARAVDLGIKLDHASSSQAARALGSQMTPGEWCADFVNGALHAAGSHGVNSHIANAFLGWGHEVSKEAARKGDVLVEDRGRGVGNPGGHAGLFTGQTRMRNGRLQMEMLSGNYGDHVNAHDWTDADRLHIRRDVADLVGEARKAGAGDTGAGVTGSIEAHVHLHQDGRVRGATARSTGAVAPPQLHLQRGPTMTQPNTEA